jgi:hypothetical protein
VKVLIFPEDPSLDKFILKPIVERIFQDLGRTVRVDVLEEPHLAGITQALDSAIIAEVLRDNPMTALFLLIVDRDCNRFKNMEKALAREAEHGDCLIACLAVEEVEVWMLALHRDVIGAGWSEVRGECDPKERFADPVLDSLGRDSPGRGRKGAMRSLGAQWRGLLDVCPEIAELKGRIARWLAVTASR